MEKGTKMSFVFSPEFIRVLKKISKKDKLGLKKIETQVNKIVLNPIIGKPLRNVLKNYRRVHIESFVLIYKIENNEITFIDYAHHDRVYKKYAP